MKGFIMNATSALLVVATGITLEVNAASSVRSNNGPNCVGVSSCRPRCLSFHVDRSGSSVDQCDILTGTFQVQSDITPWDTKSFRTYNCDAAGTCMNERCGLPLPANMTMRISEEGYAGQRHTLIELSENEDAFTYCSVYKCPKDECALPSQLGHGLKIEMVDSSMIQAHQLIDAGDGSLFLSPNHFTLGLEIALKAAFVGKALFHDESTSFGPLRLTWVDDPSGCREGELPYYAPVAPPSNPHVIGGNIFDHEKESLYCSGEEYEPAPLPVESPPPSLSPSISMSPTPKPTLSAIQTSQLAGLWSFYESVNMSMVTSPSHNWFIKPGDDYCMFTGIECNRDMYVTSISLVNMNLTGSLSLSSLKPLRKLTKLKLVGNKIQGPLPDLASMQQLQVLELAVNRFTGTVPESIGDSRKLRRLLIQSNHLHGTLPSSICRLNQTLTAIDISNNNLLHGQIPQCYGDMSLSIFRAEGIGLIGSVPAGLCGIRDMNGLDPNPFGCNAIACPAGTYQPFSGRQTSDDTPCLQCQSPSNVIGSKTCAFLDGNDEITLEPTQSLMPSNNIITTSSPTQAPTSNSAVSNSSLEPTSTTLPAMEDQGPALTTPSAAEHFLEFALQFDSISILIEDQETIEIFINVTKEFIESTMTPNAETANVSISSVEVISQFLEAPWNNSSVSIFNSTSSHRLLQSSIENPSVVNANEVLTVSMRLSGIVEPIEPPPEFSFSQTTLHGFFSNMTLYMTSLADSSQFFATPINRLAAINAPLGDEAENDDNGRIYLGVIIPLIIIGCIIVAFLLLKKNTSRSTSLHVEAYNGTGPLSMMPSGSSLEEQFNEHFDPSPPPPPPPDHLSHSIDVHHCASSTCSSCHMSSNSTVVFVSVEEKNFSRESLDNPSPHIESGMLEEEDVAPRDQEGWIASSDEGVEWREIGGEI